MSTHEKLPPLPTQLPGLRPLPRRLPSFRGAAKLCTFKERRLYALWLAQCAAAEAQTEAEIGLSDTVTDKPIEDESFSLLDASSNKPKEEPKPELIHGPTFEVQ